MAFPYLHVAACGLEPRRTNEAGTVEAHPKPDPTEAFAAYRGPEQNRAARGNGG